LVLAQSREGPAVDLELDPTAQPQLESSFANCSCNSDSLADPLSAASFVPGAIVAKEAHLTDARIVTGAIGLKFE
jgi:hypothetical protein